MQVAEVKIWGTPVGAVAWDDESGYATFEYDPKFKQTGWDLSPLKMSVAENRNQYSFPNCEKT
jgi:serine/threonine-protein kinase HipA